MAATIDHDADDRGDVTMTVGNQKRRQIPGLRAWIIDSGAMTHVLRLVVAQEYLGILEKSHGVELRGADGHQLNYYGSVEMIMIMGGRKHLLRAVVADVRRNLLSVRQVEDHGYAILFKQNQSMITRENWHVKNSSTAKIVSG